MEEGLVLYVVYLTPNFLQLVLILVVMEEGLVRQGRRQPRHSSGCLNPCCNGRGSRTGARTVVMNTVDELS